MCRMAKHHPPRIHWRSNRCIGNSEQSPKFDSDHQARETASEIPGQGVILWREAPMQRSLFLCVAFGLSNLGGSSQAQELPDTARSYLAEKARLLAADAALRFDAD